MNRTSQVGLILFFPLPLKLEIGFWCVLGRWLGVVRFGRLLAPVSRPLICLIRINYILPHFIRPQMVLDGLVLDGLGIGMELVLE